MKDLWNGMFDFNGDGRTDIGEEFMAFMMFESAARETEVCDDEEEE